ncbi:cytochrome d ubiquinol oxidase subunit II [Microbacterium resistens]|uniref:Cytochrome d ubiquinol oxidase subunit II n=1 Tax=Microbacterium resistens TaxID=156977 RepID=A0ABY3RTI4_9MICO|nr:cytochrome d ubiquinol oxidase subunit II [Microbacterium resistens]UGS26209.1 cytochrome d ubiquinol oxidase subunit II [Microbacterium resistens]
MDLAYLWFWIVAFLFVGYFVLDGFDFGVGMSLPFLGKDDVSRRQIINTIGPVWDLNETWVIVAGACLFASFPEWYASLFSGFYLPLLIILLALILRGVSFEYRHQRDDPRWKRRFDTMIVVGSAVPALLWGVAFGNIVQGVPLNEDHVFTGSLFTLLNPYGLLVGVTTLLLFFLHGVTFVALKTDGPVRENARRLALRASLPTVLAAAATVVWTIVIAAGRPSLLAMVVVFGALAAVALLASVLFTARGREGWAFVAGMVTTLAAVVMLFGALFPNVLPSTTDPAFGLTIENASSTPYTLQIMTWTALIAMPLVLAYQAWTYWVFRKRVTRTSIEAAPAHA